MLQVNQVSYLYNWDKDQTIPNDFRIMSSYIQDIDGLSQCSHDVPWDSREYLVKIYKFIINVKSPIQLSLPSLFTPYFKYYTGTHICAKDYGLLYQGE